MKITMRTYVIINAQTVEAATWKTCAMRMSVASAADTTKKKTARQHSHFATLV